jgi:hypothetical protein
LSAGASSDVLEAAERALGVALPPELRHCLQETDGVSGEYGEPLIFSADALQRENLALRHDAALRGLYMPFDALLFFGAAINGDHFGYRILVGEIRSLDVYRWDHENDSREWFASGLTDFLGRYASA